MFLSVTELFKIGIGPSSSHTVGPMIAARRFMEDVEHGHWPRPANAAVAAIKVYLYGSLAYTGKGHATDRAIILGLNGYQPETIHSDQITTIVEKTYKDNSIQPFKSDIYRFNPEYDIVWLQGKRLEHHTNGMAFEALDREGQLLLRRHYYSVGGGFVLSDEEFLRQFHHKDDQQPQDKVAFPFANGKEMLNQALQSGLTIAQMKRANEEIYHSRQHLDQYLDTIWQVMNDCIERGLHNSGQLPGGLKVERRAAHIYQTLQQESQLNRFNPLQANDWLSVYAIAVSEENAAGGRVVTAPTNGAAGIIPAVFKYYMHFHPQAQSKDVRDYLLTAAAIGGLLKHNASISGAEVGCQGEVGSASAMAAAGLAALLGANPQQAENAAEIALEHHLGMTCDPIKGLVQVPCIERNALGAVKAVTATSLALKGNGQHFVSLDACIETMRQTGMDMDERYKETSRGGLAVNVSEC